MKYPTCPHCAGEDILLDALCAWNASTGAWELDCDEGNYFCRTCEETSTEDQLVWKPFPDE